jgi:uncharacterized protein YndB with AHSA1/START domain
MNADRAVEVSVHIAAQPETVFPYFTDRPAMSSGWAPGPCWSRYQAAATAS